MNLLFMGNSDLLFEWLPFCDGHRCVIMKNRNDMPIPDYATIIGSPDTITEIDIVFDLHLKSSEKRRARLRDVEAHVGDAVPILTNTVLSRLSEIQSWLKKPERVFGVAAFPTLASYPVAELSLNEVCADVPHTVATFMTDIGKTIEVHREGVGHVFPRIVAMIINEAVFALQQGIATDADIDTAMKLGVNYPSGPIEWGVRIGWKNLLRLLEAMHAEFGDDRYRPAPLLRSFATRGR